MAGSGSDALLVGVGAVPGAWLRLILVNRWSPIVPKKHWGTFAVNVIACFALGLVLSLIEAVPQDAKAPLALLIAVGFFGSLSTFSTFVLELLAELQARRPATATLLALASIVVGLMAAAAGYGLGYLNDA
ncbi:CrcB family protein [Synechococcus sp. CC9616]|uniref:fluoride efflux transporter FluC n=1 Tax=Synechococcus sp. CC9616 TaxID=110663 RepID=UPI00049156ED|nr:CrcB family protein [Synechococcus sp. CC9616]